MYRPSLASTVSIIHNPLLGAVEKGPSAMKPLPRSGVIRSGTVAPDRESTAEGGCSTLFQQPRFPPIRYPSSPVDSQAWDGYGVVGWGENLGSGVSARGRQLCLTGTLQPFVI